MKTIRTSALIGLVLTALVLVGPFATSARAQGIGRSLDIQPGARQNAMGAAGVALLADPCDAAWWNPAALGFARTFGAKWTRAQLVPGLAPDVWFNHAVAAFPIPGFGGIAVSGTRVDYGTSVRTDPQGRPTGTFESYENSGAISIGYRPVPELALGVSAKYIHIALAAGYRGGTENTFGFDLGALYRVVADPLTVGFGVNVQNLGPEVSFLNASAGSPLSRNLKVGTAIEYAFPLEYGGYELGVVAAGDFNQSLVTDGFRTWNGGVEFYGGYGRWGRLMLRGGYYYDGLGDISDVTFGFGARILGASFDAGWIPQARGSDLDRVMKLTFGLHSDFLSTWQ